MTRYSGGKARSLTPVVVIIVLVLLLGAAVSWGNFGHDAEVRALRAIALREGQSPDALIAMFQGISWAGDAAQRSIIMIAFALWLDWQKRPRAGLLMLVMPSVAGAVSSLLKQVFARERPEVVPHLDHFANLSFPSGHATNAVAILLLAALLIPSAGRRSGWVVLALILAGLVCASRLLLGVHWPSDVAGGALLGASFAVLGARLNASWARGR